MRALTLCFVFALLALAPPVHADQVTVNGITLHYSAMPSVRLTPEVARQYGLTRSASRALLNLALRRDDAGVDVAVPARITASATNENGQRQELRLREVREGDAIYYLAEVRISDREVLNFEINADVDGRPLQASFRQQFFVDR